MHKLTTFALSALAGTLITTAPVVAGNLALDFGPAGSSVEGDPSPTGLTWQLFPVVGDDPSKTYGSVTVSLSTFDSTPARDRGGPLDNSNFSYGDLLRDLATDFGGPNTLTLEGLDPNTSYNVRIWSIDNNFNNGETFTWFDDTSGTPAALGSVVNQTGATPTSNLDFSVFGQVTPDTNGTVLLDFDGAGSGAINALELTVVPEPTAVLGGLTLIGGVLLRRRG